MENETFPTLEAFQDKIARLKEIEKAKRERGEVYNPDLVAIKKEKLTEKDQEIYERFNSENLEVEYFNEYRKEVPREDEARYYFASFVANQLQKQVLQKGLKKNAVSHEQTVHKVERDPELQRLAAKGAQDTKEAGERIIEILRPKPQEPKQ